MKHPLRRRWMYAAFLAARASVRWLPLSVVQAIGRVVGYAAYGLLGRIRTLSYAHVRYALGAGVSDWTCHRVARGAFINLGKNVLEWFVLDRLSPARIQRLVNVQGVRHLERALAQGRGVIALSAHFGNWELLALALASLGFHGGVLARRLRYPEYERFLVKLRQRKGVSTLERGSLKDVATALRTNQIIGMMPDQDIDSLDGVFVDFFDRPAYTPVGPAALALITGAPILPCFLVRVGRRFRVYIEEPIPMPHSGDRARDLAAITQAWSRVVESYVRRHPDHWVWMHRRWKTQPVSAVSSQQSAVSTMVRQPHNPTQALQPVVSFMLVAGCWLLVAGFAGCAKSAPPAAKPPPAASVESPDTTRQMDRFSMTGYDADGRKRWDLAGTGASAEGTFVTIHHPDATSYDLADPAGGTPAKTNGAEHPIMRTAYLTASVAQVDQTTRRVRLEHEVTIHTSDGLWLTSPIMYWLPDHEEMTTDDPVRMETDHMLLRGRGGIGYSQLKTAVLLRDIELVLNPESNEQPGEIQHVTITCDGPLTFEYVRGIATFEQNVHVKDAQGDLYSDKLVAYVDQQTRTIRYADAIGHVRILQGPHTATGERAVYEPAKTKVTLLGSPSLVVSPDATTPAPTLPMTPAPAPRPLVDVPKLPESATVTMSASTVDATQEGAQVDYSTHP